MNSRTKTTVFLFPLIGFSKEWSVMDRFKNAYVNIEGRPKEEGVIYAIYTKTNGLRSISTIKLPINTLNKFIKGRYSLFSEEEKAKILSFWGLTKESRLYKILYPSHEMYESYSVTLRAKTKAEIWPKPNLAEETFIEN